MPQTAKPILCVDFDGVIHSYKSGWITADNIPDPPVPGAIEWLYRALQFFDVQIYSSRSKHPAGIQGMRSWLLRHACEIWPDHPRVVNELMAEIKFPIAKPAAFLTIDDRAICFTGDWDALNPVDLLRFKPWYYQHKEAAK